MNPVKKALKLEIVRTDGWTIIDKSVKEQLELERDIQVSQVLREADEVFKKINRVNTEHWLDVNAQIHEIEALQVKRKELLQTASTLNAKVLTEARRAIGLLIYAGGSQFSNFYDKHVAGTKKDGVASIIVLDEKTAPSMVVARDIVEKGLLALKIGDDDVAMPQVVAGHVLRVRQWDPDAKKFVYYTKDRENPYADEKADLDKGMFVRFNPRKNEWFKVRPEGFGAMAYRDVIQHKNLDFFKGWLHWGFITQQEIDDVQKIIDDNKKLGAAYIVQYIFSVNEYFPSQRRS